MQRIKVSVLKSWHFLVNKVEVERGITLSEEERVGLVGNLHYKQCPPLLLSPLPVQKLRLREGQRQRTSLSTTQARLDAMGEVSHPPKRSSYREQLMGSAHGCCCGVRRAWQPPLPGLCGLHKVKDGLDSAKPSGFCLFARMEAKSQI